MSQPFDFQRLQFYLTVPAPCPYLPGKMERKVFTPLDPLAGPHLNDYLTHSGFRRSQNVIYRPACETCNACRSLRVLVKEFSLSKSRRRVWRKNTDLTAEIVEPYATREQFDLLQRYLAHRHPDGGMIAMDFARYETMVEDCASRTFVTEYRDADDVLIACALIDEMSDGLSMIYSFFDPEASARSLGTFMILYHIDLCLRNDLPYVYLGYWVKGSRKMDYKATYGPAEVLINNMWQPLPQFDNKTAANDRGQNETP